MLIWKEQKGRKGGQNDMIGREVDGDIALSRKCNVKGTMQLTQLVRLMLS